mmetsp:Transcript_5642/g.15840  ORF Transcript_5642/g.15840 Transcript_5642/m.15840 type:complete len:244 (-) Transcript_5642:94-825(-)
MVRREEEFVEMQIALGMRLVDLVHEAHDALAAPLLPAGAFLALAQRSEQIGIQKFLGGDRPGRIGVDGIEHLPGGDDAGIVPAEGLDAGGTVGHATLGQDAFQFGEDEIPRHPHRSEIFVQDLEGQRDLFVVDGRGRSAEQTAVAGGDDEVDVGVCVLAKVGEHGLEASSCFALLGGRGGGVWTVWCGGVQQDRTFSCSCRNKPKPMMMVMVLLVELECSRAVGQPHGEHKIRIAWWPHHWLC